MPHSISLNYSDFGELGNFWADCPESVKMGGRFYMYLLSCVMAAAEWVKVAGSIPTFGILLQMCECVNALRVMNLHIRTFAIKCRLWGANPQH